MTDDRHDAKNPADAPDTAPRPYMLAGFRTDGMGSHLGIRNPRVALAAVVGVAVVAAAAVVATGGGQGPALADAAMPSQAAGNGFDLPVQPPMEGTPSPTDTGDPGWPEASPDPTEVAPSPSTEPSGAPTAPQPTSGGPKPTAAGPKPTGAVAAPRPSATTGSPSTAAAGGRPILGHQSDKCLQAAARDGAPVQLSTCNGSTQQQWTIMSDGTIRTGGFCMDAAWAGTANGTVVQVARCSGGNAQRFTLNTSHDIVGQQAHKCVDAKDNATGDGTPTQLWTCLGTRNQKWTMK